MNPVTRRKALQMLGVVAVVGLIPRGSGGDSTPDSSPEGLSSDMLIIVDVYEDNVIHAIFPDGTETSGQDAYEAKIRELDQQGIIDTEVELEFGARLSQMLDTDLGNNTTAVTKDAVFQFNEYTLSTGYNWGSVAGCIRRDTHYVAVRLNYGRRSTFSQIFDLHIASWTDGGWRCFGFYESVHKKIDWCNCNTPGLDQIRDAIYNAATNSGVGDSMSLVIAVAAAPFVLSSVLAL